MFDYMYKMVTDQHRMVNWRNNSHPRGLINLYFKVPTFPFPLYIGTIDDLWDFVFILIEIIL